MNIPKKGKWLASILAGITVTGIVLAGCSSSPSTTTPSSGTTTPPTTGSTSSVKSLTGAGSTFAQPLYTLWFADYAKLTGLEVNYQGIGSGGGINGITNGTLDFGASDAIMTDDQVKAAESAHGPILHIPMFSGATAIVYNLSGIPSGTLKLTGPVLADIYLKKVQKWNDPEIAALNPGVNLPDEAITCVHRAEGSGTTYIFTNYLSKVSDQWKTQVGNATSVNWPGDIGGQGNQGVAGQVLQTPGAIGYVELAYVIQNNMPYILMQNAAGNYEAPTLNGTTAAAQGVTLPDDMKVMITDSANPDAYPIAGFTWILAYVNQTNQAKGEALAKLLWWGIHDGQQYATQLDYAPLSADAVAKAEKEIESMNYQGKPFITP